MVACCHSVRSFALLPLGLSDHSAIGIRYGRKIDGTNHCAYGKITSVDYSLICKLVDTHQ